MLCCCGTIDYDSPQIATIEDRKARKTYICCECGEKIKVGDKYEFGKRYNPYDNK